jgi:putative membrane fusion protein
MGKSVLHRSDSGSIENDIMSRVTDIYDYAEQNDIQKIVKTREAINSLRRNGEYSSDAGIEELEERKEGIQDKIGFERKEIYTEISGVFSTYLDGLESVLSPDRISDYSPSYIKGLKPLESKETGTGTVETGDPICKIMNNHVWYTLTVLNGDSANECKKGRDVKLRFKNMANAEVNGTIEYVSDKDSDGNVLVMVRCSTYLESVFSYRQADVEIIFDSYTGYKVPVNAIRTYDNGYKVIAQAGSTNFDCDVDVLYTDKDEGFSIIESTEDATNKLLKAERIVVGDTK